MRVGSAQEQLCSDGLHLIFLYKNVSCIATKKLLVSSSRNQRNSSFGCSVRKTIVKSKDRLEVELRSIPKYSGSYLLVDLCIEFELVKECVYEIFALDTGSPFMWRRRELVEKWADLSEFKQSPVQVGDFGGKSFYPPEMRNVRFPEIEFQLPKAFITSEKYDKPFGLLGMDFLVHWIMRFDPRPGRGKAVLDRIKR